MVKLSKSDKKVICIEFAEYIPKIRDILHLKQQEFGERCGISTDRLSRIENGHAVMTWGQYSSILLICFANIDTKEYVFANSLVKPEVLQFFQMRDENIPPIINVNVQSEIVKEYIERHRSKHC